MKKHAPLIFGIGIPVLFICVLFITVSIPKLLSEDPKTSFVFSLAMAYPQDKCIYQVSDSGSIELAPNLSFYTFSDKPVATNDYNSFVLPPDFACTERLAGDLYMYDASQQTIVPVALEDVSGFMLDDSLVSDDGFYVQDGQMSYNSIFFSTSNPGFVSLVKDGVVHDSFDVPGVDASNYYNYQFMFMGWVDVNEESHE